MNSNILRGIARPKNDPSIRVTVQVTKDFKFVDDNYLTKVVAQNATKPIEALAQSIWADSRVNVAIDTNLIYPEHTDLSMSYEEFLKYYPAPITTLLIGVSLNGDDYIDNQGDLDYQTEMHKYEEFSKLLVEKNYVSSRIGIRYLTPQAYARFDEAQNSEVSVSDFFRDMEKKEGIQVAITIISYKIQEDGQLEGGKEEIYRFFDIWEQRRKEYLEKRDEL